MEFSSAHIKVSGVKTLPEQVSEQSAELDYILPDYCPDIFRILKCSLSPTVTQTSLAGSRLTVEGSAKFTVLYRSAENKSLNAISKQVGFTKLVELPEQASDGCVNVSCGSAQVSCRVQNQRRVCVRGSFPVKVRLSGEEQLSVLSNASGSGIALKRESASVVTNRLCVNKRVTASADVELSEKKPDVASIIDCLSATAVTELSTISGKAAVKGEANVRVLYNTEDETTETLSFSVPFSNILDLPDLDESYKLRAEITDESVEFTPKGDSAREFSCDVSFTVALCAIRLEELTFVTDAYSTEYECETQYLRGVIELPPIEKTVTAKAQGTVTSGDSELSEVIASFAECTNVQYRIAEDGVVVFGNVPVKIAARDTDGAPVCLEGMLTFECPTELDASGALDISCYASITSVECSVKSPNATDVTVTVDASVAVRKALDIGVIEDIKLSDTRHRDKSDRCAVKLYRTDESETAWQIAKKFHTDEKAVISENEAAFSSGKTAGMLLIPITD